jgi:hypothetical protein
MVSCQGSFHCEPNSFWSDISLIISSFSFLFFLGKEKTIVEGNQPWLVGYRNHLCNPTNELIPECMDALA